MSIIRQEYRDWVILITEVGSRWTFTCCHPDGDPLANSQTYKSHQVAYSRARVLIDCMMIRGQLSELLDDWLEAGSITAQQYGSADRLIGALIRIEIASHEASDRILLESPLENPPDSAP